jgi:hypothetical protein
MRVRLKYVHHFIDDRYGKAKGRYYFRRRGFKQTPLPGLPGSAEFNEAYEEALAGQSAPPLVIGTKRIRAGSIGALAIAYFNSPSFQVLSSSTRNTYRAIIEAFIRQHEDKPLALLTRQHINAMLAHKVKSPAAANHWLRLVKTLMHFAQVEGMRSDDPTIGISYIKRRSSGFHTWTESEIAQFEAAHPIGTPARLALGLLLRAKTIRCGGHGPPAHPQRCCSRPAAEDRHHARDPGASCPANDPECDAVRASNLPHHRLRKTFHGGRLWELVSRPLQ